ncbi:MAG: exo-alpha-sialidase, partial [Sphingobacteriales bacterium]
MFVCAMMLHTNIAYAQPATITIPVGIGNPCNAGSADSLKYYNYNDITNVLSHRSNCKPNLVAPGFSDNLATIQFNPFDGYLYFAQITSSAGVYTTHFYRWLPTTCPNSVVPLVKQQVFNNQLVVGVEFDPATGDGYQINFIDTTGVPASDIDPAGANVGQHISSASINGLPAAAYFDATNGDLKYNRAIDIDGINWNAPTVVAAPAATSVGLYTSLQQVNGRPAISYFDDTNDDLKYVRALDANGTTWGIPVTVEGLVTNVGLYSSMFVVNGMPAIAYYDDGNDDLKYVRALDANGTTWGTPVTLDATGNTGQFTSLKIVNGMPAVVYYDVSNGDLRYIRATNVNGTTWAAPITLDATNNQGQYASLEIVNGNPAVSYHDATGLDLRYIRATDANGTAWAAPVTPIALNTTGQFTSLKVINGNPAISYYDATALDLKYIRATDINGTTWGVERTAEATGNKGQYSNLMIVNGNPAIVYYDVNNNNARFIRSYDITGTLWFANHGVYDMELQQVNFSTNTLGISRKMDFGNRYIYRQSGDVVMTPGRQMLAAFDNKYFTINWQDYASATPLVATYIDTLILGAGNNLVGLAYASGKLVGSVRAGSICNSFHREIEILTGALSPITSTDNFTSADMTNIPTGIGMAKQLISASLVSPGTYDVVYEIVIRNYGGTPISNIQAYDTLNNINGTGNNLSASITSFSGPAGISPNGSFDGRTAGNFSLLVPGSTLSNVPGQNVITLRITCRIRNILAGVVYNNSATVTGTNIFGDPLRDVSTNGPNPDLNSNDKPDDVGENQPTPLLITVPAITPPCAALVNVLYTQTFGAGTGTAAIIPAPVVGTGVFSATGSSGYTSALTPPLPLERYMLTNNANNADGPHFINLTDHTGDPNGRMLV